MFSSKYSLYKNIPYTLLQLINVTNVSKLLCNASWFYIIYSLNQRIVW